jgi:hypothetical protein
MITLTILINTKIAPNSRITFIANLKSTAFSSVLNVNKNLKLL